MWLYVEKEREKVLYRVPARRPTPSSGVIYIIHKFSSARLFHRSPGRLRLDYVSARFKLTITERCLVYICIYIRIYRKGVSIFFFESGCSP